MKIDINRIPIQNTRNGKIFYKSVKEINEDKKRYNKYNISYEGFVLRIEVGPLGNYNGYILRFPKNMSKKFTVNEKNNLESIKGIYVPHGGYTDGRGFDCLHFTDFFYNGGNMSKQPKTAKSWKTHKFVESELKKIVDSLLKITGKQEKRTDYVKINENLCKFLDWSHALSILTVLDGIRTAYLILGKFNANKIKRISKIVGPKLFITVIEFKPKRFYTLFYLEPMRKNVEKYVSDLSDKELLGKILGYGCPWKKGRVVGKVTYVYNIEVISDETGQYDDIMQYVCDKPSVSYNKQLLKQAKRIKDLTNKLNSDSYIVSANVTKRVML